MNKGTKELALELIDFINNSPTQYHAVKEVKKQLITKGFSELKLTDEWQIEKGGKYFVSRNESSVFAFTIGTGDIAQDGFRFIAAHTDSPNFKIKTQPDIKAEGGYHKLNTEVYGGPIFHTWLDRPLSVAGRVSLKSERALWPTNRLVKINKPILYIPNLAIHLNREINEGKAYNPQIDMLPIMGQINENLPSERTFYNILADELKVEPDQILDFDLHLFEDTKGCLVGANEEFISSGRLDNLAMIHAGLTAITNSTPQEATNVLVCFDNEEIGSQTKQGAGSPVLRQILERIVEKLSNKREDYYRALYHSFMISADMAHAVHPNQPDKHDPITRPQLNQGPVIKIHGSQKYTSDGDSVATYEMICQEADVPYQKFVNRSDMRSGGTLGSISSGQVDVRSVDIGNPMLAMHSVREMAGTLDHLYICKTFDILYNL